MESNTEYRLQVRLLSEAIFSSGEKETNLVQSKVLTDQHGFVYFHAKTLKGQLKRQAFWLLKQYVSIDAKRAISFLQSIAFLFGINNWELEMLKKEYTETGNESADRFLDYLSRSYGKNAQAQDKLPAQGIMKFSHLELPESVRIHFKQLFAQQMGNPSDAVNEKEYVYLSRHDLIAAQTHVRIGIQLEEGVVKDKMLTSAHTVRKGLIFYASLTLDNDPSEEIFQDLIRTVYAMGRIGAGIHRGRGEMEAKLLAKQVQIDEISEKGVVWNEVLSGH